MDFLKYGIEHRESASGLQRTVAKFLLKLECWKADRYEVRLNRKQISIPENPQETQELLCGIREKLKERLQQKQDQSAG